jgi:hypothetical protein
LAFFAEMVLEWKTASCRPVLATISAKKEIIQASLTIITPNMIGMRFRTAHFFSSEIETEIFSASLAEFKEVLVQSCTADLTVTDLHPFRLEV